MKKTLVKLHAEGSYLTDIGTSHSYLPIFEILFAPFRDKSFNLFEVGFLEGGSCCLWSDYFNFAKIKAIDTNPDCKKIKVPKVEIDTIDISDLPEKYFKSFPVTIGIDDGSHFVKDQILFVKKVYPALVKGGVLVIEDVLHLVELCSELDSLGFEYLVVDLRKIKNRVDDILIIIRK